MFLRLFFLLFNLTFATSLTARSYQYEVSACMIFRDEAQYLKEWVEFHRLVGIKHFYLYNNLSQDNYREVLEPYINAGIVELIEWNLQSQNVPEWDAIQVSAYNDGLKRAKKTSKWLAVLDSDEFLFPTTKNSLPDYLKKFEHQKKLGGLLVNWVVFGTSWVPKIPDDQLLIETLTLCAPEGSPMFKTIFRTRRVHHICSPHHGIYKKGYYHTSPNGNLPPAIEIDQIRINHYWPRDEWFLKNVKIPRREVWGTDSSTCQLWGEASNQVPSLEILRFVAQLRRIMLLD